MTATGTARPFECCQHAMSCGPDCAAWRAQHPQASAPYPENEQCDQYCGRPAEFRVLDQRGHELAVCCRECSPRYVPHFEDKDGNEFNP